MKWTVSVDQALSNCPSTIKGLPFWNIYLDILLNELQLNLSTAMLRFRLRSWLESKNIPKRHLHSQSRSSEFLSSTTSHKSHLSKTEPSSREATAPATDPPRCPATTVTGGWISVSDGRTLTPWGFFFFFFTSNNWCRIWNESIWIMDAFVVESNLNSGCQAPIQPLLWLWTDCQRPSDSIDGLPHLKYLWWKSPPGISWLPCHLITKTKNTQLAHVVGVVMPGVTTKSIQNKNILLNRFI